MSTETPSSVLLQLVADIRAAVGDPTGKLTQDELVAHCRSLAASSQEKYTAFGKAMWDYIIERGSTFCWEEISDEILSKAHQAGLCQRVIYDPDQHGPDTLTLRQIPAVKSGIGRAPKALRLIPLLARLKRALKPARSPQQPCPQQHHHQHHQNQPQRHQLRRHHRRRAQNYRRIIHAV